jgi:hypothetical protein
MRILPAQRRKRQTLSARPNRGSVRRILVRMGRGWDAIVRVALDGETWEQNMIPGP